MITLNLLILVSIFSFAYRIKFYFIIIILRKPPKIFWFSNMVISFWLRLFITFSSIGENRTSNGMSKC